MKVTPIANVTATEFIDEVIAMLNVAGKGLDAHAEFNGIPFKIHGSLRSSALENLKIARREHEKAQACA